MISKELLSEVLGKEIIELEHHDHAVSYWIGCEVKEDGEMVRIQAHHFKINIHELANKCKEWALEQGYFLYSVLVDKEAYAFVTYPGDTSLRLFSNHSKTEPEAIFKACEWILSELRNEKEKK